LRRLPYFLFCGTFIIFLCVSPSDAAKAVTDSLTICIRTVIPSLFPFLAVNAVVVESGFATVLGSWLKRPVRAIFAVSGAGATAFVLGALSGFPLGAECAAHMYERGQCTKDDAERLLAFCNNTGPSFLTGGIGAGMWGKPEIGWLLYASQLISAVIVGIALRFTRRDEAPVSVPTAAETELVLSPSIFTSAISQAAVTMLKICGFIAAFSVVCIMISGIFAIFGFKTDGIAAALLFGFLEITSGSGASAAVGGRAGIDKL
jgi:sporulation integral membrane protein YlbJ